jgi:hypothetical protein
MNSLFPCFHHSVLLATGLGMPAACDNYPPPLQPQTVPLVSLSFLVAPEEGIILDYG